MQLGNGFLASIVTGKPEFMIYDMSTGEQKPAKGLKKAIKATNETLTQVAQTQAEQTEAITKMAEAVTGLSKDICAMQNALALHEQRIGSLEAFCNTVTQTKKKGKKGKH